MQGCKSPSLKASPLSSTSNVILRLSSGPPDRSRACPLEMQRFLSVYPGDTPRYVVKLLLLLSHSAALHSCQFIRACKQTHANVASIVPSEHSAREDAGWDIDLSPPKNPCFVHTARKYRAYRVTRAYFVCQKNFIVRWSAIPVEWIAGTPGISAAARQSRRCDQNAKRSIPPPLPLPPKIYGAKVLCHANAQALCLGMKTRGVLWQP